MEDLPRLLEAARGGDRHALGQAFVIAYDQLHFLARNRLRREHVDFVLDATALVHECYLRLMKVHSLQLHDYSHFLGYTAHIMRSIVVDSMRRQTLLRRYLVLHMIAADAETSEPDSADESDSCAIEVALEQLKTVDQRLTRVIELRCLQGLTLRETAKRLDVSARTIRRDWQRAQTFLSSSHKR